MKVEDGDGVGESSGSCGKFQHRCDHRPLP